MKINMTKILGALLSVLLSIACVGLSSPVSAQSGLLQPGYIECNPAATAAPVRGATAAACGVPYVNLKAAPYLAKGDCSTDDTAAINAAVAAARAIGGTVFAPATGALCYSVTSPIILASDTLAPVAVLGESPQFYGTSTVSFIGNFNDSIFKFNGQPGTYSLAPSIGNVFVQNLNAGSNAAAIRGDYNSGLRVSHVNIITRNFGIYSAIGMISPIFTDVSISTDSGASNGTGVAGYKISGTDVKIFGGRVYAQQVAYDISAANLLVAGGNAEFNQVVFRHQALGSALFTGGYFESSQVLVTNATTIPINFGGHWTDNGSAGIGISGEVAFENNYINLSCDNSNLAVIKSQASFAYDLRFKGNAVTNICTNPIVGNSFTPGTTVALPSGLKITVDQTEGLNVQNPPNDAFSGWANNSVGVDGTQTYAKLNATIINGGGLAIAAGKTLTVSNSMTLSGNDGAPVNVRSGGSVAYESDPLSVFASTTSAGLRGVMSDPTGTGSLVFATNSALTTPTLSGSSTGVTTLASANAGASNFTATFPAASGTVAYTTTPAASIVVGTTTVTGGTTTRVLYDSAGVLGEYTNTQLTALVNPATASLSGALPAWPNNTTTFFRGDGSYATLNCAALSGVGTGCSAAAGITSLTGQGTATGPGAAAFVLATAQPDVHTWALAQTFTVAPVFTDASGSRTALGLGSIATQAASSVAITGGTVAGLTGFAIRDTSAAFDLTFAATSSAALTAGRTLTMNMGNVAHTLAFGTTANTITFPNVASDTVAMLGASNAFTGAANSFSVGVTPAITFIGDDTTAAPKQVVIKGLSNGNQQVLIGYNTSSDYGSIQAIKQGTAVEPLSLQPSGGGLLINGTAAVSCSANTVILLTLVVTNGIVTHC